MFVYSPFELLHKLLKLKCALKLELYHEHKFVREMRKVGLFSAAAFILSKMSSMTSPQANAMLSFSQDMSRITNVIPFEM